MFPYPKYSRNGVLNVLKNKNLLKNEIFFNSPDIDRKVNINFFAEVYLISNIDLNTPKIIHRQMFNENEIIDKNLSKAHCYQNHCDGKFLLSFEKEEYKKMVDVKLGRVTVNEGSRIFPTILDKENNQFTGIKNKPLSLKEYYEIKKRTINGLLMESSADDIVKQNFHKLRELLYENNLDTYSKLFLIQELQHKISCLFERYNLETRYNPEFLYVSKGTYIEQPFPTITKKVSLHTLIKNEHPELYRNISQCKNTLWAWDSTFLDKIEFDCLL